MPDYVTLTGTLRGNQESDVAADAPGKVIQTLVERGQMVKKGQVLVTLDARGAALGANVAAAQSKVAESQLEEAQRECERVKHLLDTKAILAGRIRQADLRLHGEAMVGDGRSSAIPDGGEAPR